MGVRQHVARICLRQLKLVNINAVQFLIIDNFIFIVVVIIIIIVIFGFVQDQSNHLVTLGFGNSLTHALQHSSPYVVVVIDAIVMDLRNVHYYAVCIGLDSVRQSVCPFHLFPTLIF